jgi:hypothetical protein
MREQILSENCRYPDSHTTPWDNNNRWLELVIPSGSNGLDSPEKNEITMHWMSAKEPSAPANQPDAVSKRLSAFPDATTFNAASDNACYRIKKQSQRKAHVTKAGHGNTNNDW